MKFYLQLLVAMCCSTATSLANVPTPRLVAAVVKTVYDPSGNSPVYDVLCPNSCSYSGGSSCDDDDDDDDGNVGSNSICTCQSSDQNCNCVLGCGCTLTGDNVCSGVSLINKTFSDIISGGPYKILAIWGGQESAQTDNICFTYFAQTGTDVVLFYISTVYKDGSNSIETYNLRGDGPGVILAGGSRCVIKDKTFGEVEGCSANTVYRCYLWGDYVSPSDRDYKYPAYAVGPLCAKETRPAGGPLPKPSSTPGTTNSIGSFQRNYHTNV